MQNKPVIAIDLGGTNIRAGVVVNGRVGTIKSIPLQAKETKEKVLQQLYGLIDEVISKDIAAIGIAVPGLVASGSRVLYDTVNIPSWKEIDLVKIIGAQYQLPVRIENDANCFALGEYYFGDAQNYETVAGLTIGTGLGTGIIIQKKLFSGKHGGAGEFGMIPYLDKNVEYYVSGKFFENSYGINGKAVYARAMKHDKEALDMYKAFGYHLGEAIKIILYALDIECFVIGGSVKDAFSFFSEAMWESISKFGYQRAVQDVKIKASQLPNSNILGAASLHYY